MKRNAALARKLLKYTANRPCQRGHRPERYAKTGQCVQCVSEYSKQKADGVVVLRLRAHRHDIADLRRYAGELSQFRRIAKTLVI